MNSRVGRFATTTPAHRRRVKQEARSGCSRTLTPLPASIRILSWISLSWLLLMGSGCALNPFRQIESIPASVKPLANDQKNETRASDSVEAAAGDGYFIGVALSGGGSRAAVFGGEVLTRLDELGVMKRVDFISGISSGSLAAAYYCASRDPEDARPGDLVWQRDVVEDLMRRGVWFDYFSRYVFNPLNLVRYYGTGLNRSYQMRTVIDQKFLHHKTFSDLNPKRPRLLMTATTLESGAVFTFTDRQLAERGIQSGVLKLADAVQASSSFPGLFHPYVLPDYSSVSRGAKTPNYVHLVDGGVYDNLGVAPLLKIFQENRHNFPKGGVIIVADASLPVEVKAKLAMQADSRRMTDFIIDVGAMRKSLDIMFEVDRLGLIRTLREDSLHLGLKVIHLHYTTGVMSDDLDLHDELPNILDLDKPVPTNVDFKKKRHLIAPTSMGISMEHARASRDAARKVIDFNLEEIRRLADDR